MTANTKLIQVIADALIGEYDEEATEWLEDGGRANIERIVAEWRAAIEEGRWVERLEDVLVLRALRHEEHRVTVLGGPNTEALIREFVDEDWRARGVETATRIGEPLPSCAGTIAASAQFVLLTYTKLCEMGVNNHSNKVRIQ